MALGLKNWDRHCCEGLGGGTRRWLSSETSNCPLGVTGTLWPLISAVDWWSTMASSSLAASFVGLLSFCPNDCCSCILFCSLLASTATRQRHLLSNICFACFQPAPPAYCIFVFTSVAKPTNLLFSLTCTCMSMWFRNNFHYLRRESIFMILIPFDRTLRNFEKCGQNKEKQLWSAATVAIRNSDSNHQFANCCTFSPSIVISTRLQC